ncbi:MAG: hypothetical protein QOJ64_1133 [Acidobacteriota bacterium]|jgi:hypothetical protein|nr:hypothetical protein [Acidobacteriota bacterium]
MKTEHGYSQTALGFLVLVIIALFSTACGSKSTNSANSSNETGTLRKSVNVADEAGANRTLQTMFRAQTEYMLSHAEDYGTFDQLVADNYLDSRFAGASPVVGGYAFKMTLTAKSGSDSAAYTVNADPRSADGTPTGGARHLYLDSTSNVIRANATRSATASDPPLE